MLKRICLMIWVTVAVFAVDSANSATLVSVDQLPPLSNDEGVAAIAFHQAYGISELTLASTKELEDKIYIPSVEDGDSVVLVAAKAGEYCIHQFKAGRFLVTSEHDDQCFQINAGKVSYSGMYEPNPTLSLFPGPAPGKIQGMVSIDDMPGFVRLLRRDFPNVAAESFPNGATAPPRGICGLLGIELATKAIGSQADGGRESVVDGIPVCMFSDSNGHSVEFSIQAMNDPKKLFERQTDTQPEGWTNWTAIRNYGLPLGREVEVSKRQDAYKIAVLTRDKVLLLTLIRNGDAEPQTFLVSAARTIITDCQIAEQRMQSCVFQGDGDATQH